MTSYDLPAWEYILPPERRKTVAESEADWKRMEAIGAESIAQWRKAQTETLYGADDTDAR